jgi:signal peptidase I
MRTGRAPRSARLAGALSRAADILLVALILVGLATVVLGRVLPALGHPVYIVAGPSMEPAIDVGSAVVLESVPAPALAVGDVVSLQSGPQRAVFTHRITRIAERDGDLWLETKGDANEASDPSLTPSSAVIGRVAAVMPHAGHALALMSTPQGVVLVLSTGALLALLGWWLDDLARERRRAHAVATKRSEGERMTMPVPAPVAAMASVTAPVGVPVRARSTDARSTRSTELADRRRRRPARPRAARRGA